MKKMTSKQIFAETIQELAEEIPIDRITVKQIVEESGLSLQTFYNHFHDKADLVVWVHLSETEKFFQKMEAGDYSFRDLLADNVRFYAEHRDYLMNAHMNTHGFESYEKRSFEYGYNKLAAYIQKKFGLEQLPDELGFLLRLYLYGSNRGYVEWQTRYNNVSEADFVSYLVDACPQKLVPYLFPENL